MEIKKIGMSGTMESSDIQFKVKPGKGRTIHLESPVKHLFEDEILAVIHDTLDRFEVKDIIVDALDSGALDCTIRARLECAILRAAEADIPWEVMHG